MSKDIIQNYEDIASRISDYIKEGNFFYIFEIEDIKKIMKNSNFTANDFVTLIEQSHHTIKANELYICTRNTNIHIQSFEDVISTLKSIKKYMKLGILNGIIDFLDQKAKEMSDSTEKIQKLQTELNKIQKQKQKSDNEIKSLQSQLNQINETTNQEAFLEKISELKKSDDFESIYNFFEELSSQGNQTIISKACEEGLWKKMTPKDSKYDESRNVLHEACKKGNLKLVKSLIECGCDKETRSYYDFTPLICASREGHLEVVKYLISIGADKEAKDSNGCTPLIQASNSGKHEIIKYLISIGADKEAKDQWGNTPLIWASHFGRLETVKYLISVGFDIEAKDNKGCTPLIHASIRGELETVKYLISVGANKEAKDNQGRTVFDVAKNNVRDYLTSNN